MSKDEGNSMQIELIECVEKKKALMNDLKRFGVERKRRDFIDTVKIQIAATEVYIEALEKRIKKGYL